MLVPSISGLLSLALLCGAGKKWELKVRHFVPWSLFIAALVFGVTYWLSQRFSGFPLLVISAGVQFSGLAITIGTILYFFFRDPNRTAPLRDDWIMSPADGTVIYIKEITQGEFPFAVKNGNTIPLSEFTTENLIADRGIQIGIAMNYLNVHVNRSPIAGKVTMLKPVPGLFASLKHIESLLENERCLMVFENSSLKVGIVQIASRLVRRIVPFVKAGQEVQQGDRVGRITFGSQVDLLVPYQDNLKVCVKEGDEVFAGTSLIVELCKSKSNSEPTDGITTN
jgi:phosphatidylserine decarboxylase